MPILTVAFSVLQLRALTILELDTFDECLERTLRQLTALTTLRVALRAKSSVGPMYCQVSAHPSPKSELMCCCLPGVSQVRFRSKYYSVSHVTCCFRSSRRRATACLRSKSCR